MRKTKKQLLGFAGLIGVAVITAVAYCLPTPSASAETSAGVTINATVRESHASIKIETPSNNSVFVNPVIPVETNFTETEKIEYYLTYTPDGGSTSAPQLVETYIPTEQSGTHNFNLSLTNGFGNYVLTAKITGVGGVSFEDSASFHYLAGIVNYIGSDEKGNPMFDVIMSPEAKSFRVQATDEDGTPIFINESGLEAPLYFDRDSGPYDSETDTVTITLPLDLYPDLADGHYDLIASFYNTKLDTSITSFLSSATSEFDYERVIEVPGTGSPGSPDSPNTGAISGTFANGQISAVDVVITALIIFTLAAGCAIMVVLRKQRR